jgi:Flp pilus assembly protein TadD
MVCVWVGCASCGRKKRAQAKPGDAPRLLKQGIKAFKQGDLDEALSKYRKAVGARPKWDKAHNLLGMALRYKYYETGDSSYRDEEVAAFRRAVKLNPNGPVARVNLATSLWQMGRLKEAARHYGEVLRKQPDHPDARAMKRRVDTASKSLDPEP